MGEKRKDQYRKCLKENPRMYQVTQQLEIPDHDPQALAVGYVFGPALGSFVMWVLEEAVKHGKKRLYFLARDGYFMYQAARLFCRRLEIPVECRYLRCSRFSLRLPMYHLNPGEALDYICRRGIGVTPEKILGRAGLSKEERDQVFQSIQISFERDEVIPYISLPGIKKKLRNCEVFWENMNRRSREAMPHVTGYLEQEGMLDGTEDAVVDSGWMGSMQKSLNEILLYMGRKQRLEGYYWGLYDLPSDVLQKEYHCYCFAPGKGLREKVHFNNCLFEAVFTAPEGMARGYERKEGRYVPCCGKISHKKKSFVKKSEKYLMNYLTLFVEEVKKTGYCRTDMIKERNTVKKLLRMIMGMPSYQEAEIFGSLLFSDDMLEDGQQPIAAPLTKEELREHGLTFRLLVMLGIRRGKRKESAWYEGSVVLKGYRVRYFLFQYTVYKYIRFLGKMYRFQKERLRMDRDE
ncbi:MAG: hypothetical protein ACOX8E_07710 [Ruminococcus sp.]|jgi:hypothetical protein